MDYTTRAINYINSRPPPEPLDDADVLRLIDATGFLLSSDLRGNIAVLTDAVNKKNNGIMKLLMKHCVLVTYDGKDDPPLVRAVREGCLRTIKELLAAGADPNARDSAGETALYYAAKFKDRRILRALIEGGADPFYKDSNGRTLFERQECVTTDMDMIVRAAAVCKGRNADRVLRITVLKNAPYAVYGMLKVGGDPRARCIDIASLTDPQMINILTDAVRELDRRDALDEKTQEIELAVRRILATFEYLTYMKRRDGQFPPPLINMPPLHAPTGVNINAQFDGYKTSW